MLQRLPVGEKLHLIDTLRSQRAEGALSHHIADLVKSELYFKIIGINQFSNIKYQITNVIFQISNIKYHVADEICYLIFSTELKGSVRLHLVEEL